MDDGWMGITDHKKGEEEKDELQVGSRDVFLNCLGWWTSSSTGSYSGRSISKQASASMSLVAILDRSSLYPPAIALHFSFMTGRP